MPLDISLPKAVYGLGERIILNQVRFIHRWWVGPLWHRISWYQMQPGPGKRKTRLLGCHPEMTRSFIFRSQVIQCHINEASPDHPTAFHFHFTCSCHHVLFPHLDFFIPRTYSLTKKIFLTVSLFSPFPCHKTSPCRAETLSVCSSPFPPCLEPLSHEPQM